MRMLLAATALFGLTAAASADPLLSLGIGPLQAQFGVPEPFYCLNGARFVGNYPYGRYVGTACFPGDVNYGYTANPGGVVVVPGRPWGGEWHGHPHRFEGPHAHH